MQINFFNILRHNVAQALSLFLLYFFLSLNFGYYFIVYYIYSYISINYYRKSNRKKGNLLIFKYVLILQKI